MQIAPRDQRRLLYRVCAVLIAMRVVSIFTVDLNGLEVSAAHGLGAVAPLGLGGVPVLGKIVSAWMHISGHIAGVVRLPSIALDLALLLIAVGYARLNGWGTLVGLLSGMFLALAPFGLDEGWRADGTPLMSVLALSALFQARKGIKLGQTAPSFVSAGLLAAATAISPVAALLLPAGLYTAMRSVTGPKPKYTLAAAWIVAIGVGIGLRLVVADGMPPQASLAAAWLADARFNGADIALPDGALDGFFEALIALSPGGATGELAASLQLHEAPAWRVWLGATLWPLALAGLFVGQVIADPAIPKRAAVSDSAGAGAADGWRSLGVAVPTSPKILGERDYMPLLLGMLVPCGWVAWACARSNPAGIPEALAIARPCCALVLGLGLTGLAGARFGAEDHQRRRFVATMVAVTLVQFALGGHHVLVGTSSMQRIAATKVAVFINEEVSPLGDKGAVIALGPHGLEVAYKLDPYQSADRVARSTTRPRDAAQIAEKLLEKPRSVIAVTGDRDAVEANGIAIGGGQGAGMVIDRLLHTRGYTIEEDGARYLEAIAVRVYRHDGPTGGIAIKPQLAPGVAP